MSETSHHDTRQGHESIPGAGRLGMFLFLSSLGMLFVASIVGYLVIRFRAEEWPPAGMPSIPNGLWSSTLVILGCSWTIHQAYRRIRQDDADGCRKMLWYTFWLGTLFMVLQGVNWFSLILMEIPATLNLYAFTFYMLTGLHAVHVIGGLIQLGFVLRSSSRGQYTAEQHSGVEYSVMYWHFLDIVWVILFALLLIAG